MAKYKKKKLKKLPKYLTGVQNVEIPSTKDPMPPGSMALDAGKNALEQESLVGKSIGVATAPLAAIGGEIASAVTRKKRIQDLKDKAQLAREANSNNRLQTSMDVNDAYQGQNIMTNATNPFMAKNGLNMQQITPENTKLIEVEGKELVFTKDSQGNYKLKSDFKDGKTHNKGGELYSAEMGSVIVPAKKRKEIEKIMDKRTGYITDSLRFENIVKQLPTDSNEGPVTKAAAGLIVGGVGAGIGGVGSILRSVGKGAGKEKLEKAGNVTQKVGNTVANVALSTMGMGAGGAGGVAGMLGKSGGAAGATGGNMGQISQMFGQGSNPISGMNNLAQTNNLNTITQKIPGKTVTSNKTVTPEQRMQNATVANQSQQQQQQLQQQQAPPFTSTFPNLSGNNTNQQPLPYSNSPANPHMANTNPVMPMLAQGYKNGTKGIKTYGEGGKVKNKKKSNLNPRKQSAKKPKILNSSKVLGGHSYIIQQPDGSIIDYNVIGNQGVLTGADINKMANQPVSLDRAKDIRKLDDAIIDTHYKEINEIEGNKARWDSLRKDIKMLGLEEYIDPNKLTPKDMELYLKNRGNLKEIVEGKAVPKFKKGGTVKGGKGKPDTKKPNVQKYYSDEPLPLDLARYKRKMDDKIIDLHYKEINELNGNKARRESLKSDLEMLGLEQFIDPNKLSEKEMQIYLQNRGNLKEIMEGKAIPKFKKGGSVSNSNSDVKVIKNPNGKGFIIKQIGNQEQTLFTGNKAEIDKELNSKGYNIVSTPKAYNNIGNVDYDKAAQARGVTRDMPGYEEYKEALKQDHTAKYVPQKKTPVQKEKIGQKQNLQQETQINLEPISTNASASIGDTFLTMTNPYDNQGKVENERGNKLRSTQNMQQGFLGGLDPYPLFNMRFFEDEEPETRTSRLLNPDALQYVDRSDPARAQTLNQQEKLSNARRNASGGNAQALVSGMASDAAQASNQLRQIDSREGQIATQTANQNVGINNQAEQFNTQRINVDKDINEANRAAARNINRMNDDKRYNIQQQNKADYYQSTRDSKADYQNQLELQRRYDLEQQALKENSRRNEALERNDKIRLASGLVQNPYAMKNLENAESAPARFLTEEVYAPYDFIPKKKKGTKAIKPYSNKKLKLLPLLKR